MRVKLLSLFFLLTMTSASIAEEDYSKLEQISLDNHFRAIGVLHIVFEDLKKNDRKSYEALLEAFRRQDNLHKKVLKDTFAMDWERENNFIPCSIMSVDFTGQGPFQNTHFEDSGAVYYCGPTAVDMQKWWDEVEMTIKKDQRSKK